MNRKRLAILLILISALPFAAQIIGLIAVGTAGCTGPDCAWLMTDKGKLAVSAVNAGAWVVYTAPLGVIGLTLLIVDSVKKG